MFLRLNLKSGYITTICFVVGLVLSSLLYILHPYTVFSLTRNCASVNIDMFRCPKVQISKTVSGVRLVKPVRSYFTLITGVSQQSLLLLREKRRKKTKGRQEPHIHLELPLSG